MPSQAFPHTIFVGLLLVLHFVEPGKLVGRIHSKHTDPARIGKAMVTSIDLWTFT
jgi:hypothetical protein